MTVWEEGISEDGVRWFSSVLEEHEKRREEARKREVEYVKTQGLLRDFPSLKVGGLLPKLNLKGGKPAQLLTQEWNMIVAPRELELQRER